MCIRDSIINKGEDYVGVLTSKVGIGSTSEGLYFYSNGSTSGISSGLYYFSSNHEQITGDIDKVTTVVTTNVSAANTTTHNLIIELFYKTLNLFCQF